MSKILVLGSEGQIGISLTKVLKNDHKNEVINCDIVLDESHDLRKNSDFLQDSFKKADFVFFLAYDVGGSTYLNRNQKSLEFIDNNVLLMKNTFSFLKKYSTPFLFASTQMSNMTHSPYGTLKKLGEHYTKILGGHIVRFWNTYGIENDPNKTHVITDFINSAISKNIINIKTNGEETRQFLHADDCSSALIKVQQNYNVLEKRYLDITSYKWNTINEVAEIVSREFNGIPIKRGSLVDTVQNNLQNEPELYFKKFWSPKISLEDGISIISKYMLNSKSLD